MSAAIHRVITTALLDDIDVSSATLRSLLDKVGHHPSDLTLSSLRRIIRDVIRQLSAEGKLTASLSRPSFVTEDEVVRPTPRPQLPRFAPYRNATTSPPPEEPSDEGESIAKVDVGRMAGTKSQRAMALAMRHPTDSKGGRGIRKTVEVVGFSEKRLAQARHVLRHSRKLAYEVLAGTKSLDHALTELQKFTGGRISP
jgi:hypothetical protein